MTEALQVYWPACDVITGSRVWVTVKLMLVANTLSPGPISCTVGGTARYGISVTVHCTVCESPAVTVESSGEIITSGAGRTGERAESQQYILPLFNLDTFYSDDLHFTLLWSLYSDMCLRCSDIQCTCVTASV